MLVGRSVESAGSFWTCELVGCISRKWYRVKWCNMLCPVWFLVDQKIADVKEQLVCFTFCFIHIRTATETYEMWKELIIKINILLCVLWLSRLESQVDCAKVFWHKVSICFGLLQKCLLNLLADKQRHNYITVCEDVHENFRGPTCPSNVMLDNSTQFDDEREVTDMIEEQLQAAAARFKIQNFCQCF